MTKPRLIPFILGLKPGNECILWPGAISTAGYGIILVNGKTMGAHRFSYMTHKGKIPHRMFVCHHCDTPACINPRHLFTATHAGNMEDMVRKGRANPWGLHVTHCPQGHEYNEANTYKRSGIRYCRTCVRDRSREYQRRKRQALAAAQGDANG